MAGLATESSGTSTFPFSSGLPKTASVMLYNGISNRSRGWKSKKPGDIGGGPEEEMSRQPSLKKFDGAARSCAGWDHLRKDPEMWSRDGNCFIHLYEKGQSLRGPAFKIPFTALLAAHCQPLIEKFVDRTLSEEETSETGRVDLYIPAPSTATRAQALQYHLTTRNFFAWMFRRSVVGDQLGTALIGLYHTMEEFREPNANNLMDLLDYLDEEGYLDMRNQPNHALAVLHLAEHFQITDLYIDAFAHCVGMSERLFKHSEYSRISITSRKLIRRGRVDMDFRLSRAGAMLGDLMHEELSETHLGLSTGARAHLDRFRAYIQGFYTTKFGSFPPPPADPRCSTILQAEVYRVMQVDFEALYEYLVDNNFTPATAETTPSGAQGGLCSLQSVHEFDLRHRFTPLDHPLPLLPEPPNTKDSQRRKSLPWFTANGRIGTREGKLRPDQRLQAHAALLRATNHSKTSLLDNRLVLAYRQFEEDSILIPHKSEPGVGPVDARKVRWLFIYAMYQTLRGCAETPSEVRFAANVNYHLGVSTKALPPWKENTAVRPSAASQGRDSVRKRRPRFPDRERTISAIPLLSPITSPEKVGMSCGGMEIKPDIDYFALRRQEEDNKLRGRDVARQGGTAMSRSRSQSPTRSKSFRRSLGVFRNSSQRRLDDTAASGSASRKLSGSGKGTYHEIIVQGYGNGTNAVVDVSAEKDADSATDTTSHLEVEGEQIRPHSTGSPHPYLTVVTDLTAHRSASTGSANSYHSSVSMSTSSTAVQSHASASTTPTTLVDPHSPTVISRQESISWRSTANTLLADVNSPTTLYHADEPQDPLSSDFDRSLTFPICRQSVRKSVRNMYSHDDVLAIAPPSEAPPLPRRSSKRPTPMLPLVSISNQRWSMASVLMDQERPEEVLDDDDDDDDYGSDPDYTSLQPRPLRIRKISPSQAADTSLSSPLTSTHNEHEKRGEDDVFRGSSDWERTLNNLLDVSPPCGWEQFSDLGGLQPIHLLSK